MKTSRTSNLRGRLVCRWCVRSAADCGKLRSSLPQGRIARVIFCVEKDCMVLLHGFMKKTQKTPKQEIDLALKRKMGTQP